MLVDQYDKQCETTFDAEGFVEHLMSPCGGRRSPRTAQSAAKSVHYFFSYKQYSQPELINILLSRANIKDFVHHLEKVKGYASSTITERIGWLNDALDYLTTKEESCSVKLCVRIDSTQKFIGNIKKSLYKSMEEQRNEQAKISYAKV